MYVWSMRIKVQEAESIHSKMRNNLIAMFSPVSDMSKKIRFHARATRILVPAHSSTAHIPTTFQYLASLQLHRPTRVYAPCSRIHL